jgi:hypothetical protein
MREQFQAPEDDTHVPVKELLKVTYRDLYSTNQGRKLMHPGANSDLPFLVRPRAVSIFSSTKFAVQN